MFITVGEIVKAQGIKGEIKVLPLTDDILRFKKLKKVYICQNLYEIKSLRIGDGFVYLALNEVNDRNGAEKLIGKEIQIDRNDAVKLPENTYFISDIIGCEVFLSDMKYIGKVDYVYQNGAADVYEVKGEKDVMFPFLNRLVESVDITNKKIVLNKDEFSRVAVYED